MGKDYYEILGVARDASTEEIKRAFRRLARETHPDAKPGDREAEARFREIAEAYEVLSNPERRRAYDRGATFDLSELFAGVSAFDDLLAAVFGNAGLFGTGTRPVRRGRDVVVLAEVDLHGAAFGTSSDIRFEAASRCESCGGTGVASGSAPETCPRCGGSGAVRVARRGLLGSMMSVTTCDLCRGSGEVINDPCGDCAGNGAKLEERTVVVEIPAGVSDGTRLRLNGQGEAGRMGAPPGDLYVEIRVAPDERYQRRGDDLVYSLPIGIAEAALGTAVEVPLLEGGDVTVDIPAGTQPNTVIRIPDRGVPRLRRRGRGSLLVQVDVVVPSELTPEQEAALRNYGELRGEHARAEPPRRRRQAR